VQRLRHNNNSKRQLHFSLIAERKRGVTSQGEENCILTVNPMRLEVLPPLCIVLQINNIASGPVLLLSFFLFLFFFITV